MADEASAAAGTAEGAEGTGGEQQNQQTQQTQQQQQTSWMDSLGSDELKGWAQNRGYGELSIEDVVPKMAASYRGLEQKMGVPAERLMRLPEQLEGDAMNEIYDRLGRPQAADQYEFGLPDDANPDFVKWAGDTFHKLGLSKAQGQALVQAYSEFENGLLSGEEKDSANASQEQYLALQKEWGNAYDQNKRIAGNVRSQLGISDEEVDAIQNAIGFDRVMKMFHSIGVRTMEPALVQGEGENANGILTPEQAKAKIAELKDDPGFRKALTEGGPQSKEKRQWDVLHQMAYPDDGSAQVVRA